MMLENYGVTEENWRDAAARAALRRDLREPAASSAAPSPRSRPTPTCTRRNGGSFSSGELAREYGFTDVDGSQPDCWRYIVEVQEAGKPADATGTLRLPVPQPYVRLGALAPRQELGHVQVAQAAGRHRLPRACDARLGLGDVRGPGRIPVALALPVAAARVASP